MRHEVKSGDFVVVMNEPINGINRYGRVEKIEKGIAYITNLNMPFMGSWVMHPVPVSELRKQG